MNEISIDVEQLERLPIKSLLAAIEAMKQGKKNAEKQIATVRYYSAMFSELEALEVEPRFSAASSSIDLQFTGTADLLAKVWVVLRRHGFKPGNRPKAGEPSYSTYWTPRAQPEGMASIWMYFTSSVCKRVQTGTKMVETPVYETQCGELLPTVLEDSPAPCEDAFLTADPPRPIPPAPSMDDIPF
jgi:hypothetical protein